MRKPAFVRFRTRGETRRRIFVLVATLGSVQFILNGLGLVLAREVMIGLWFTAGISAGVASVFFEIYKLKQVR